MIIILELVLYIIVNELKDIIEVRLLNVTLPTYTFHSEESILEIELAQVTVSPYTTITTNID